MKFYLFIFYTFCSIIWIRRTGRVVLKYPFSSASGGASLTQSCTKMQYIQNQYYRTMALEFVVSMLRLTRMTFFIGCNDNRICIFYLFILSFVVEHQTLTKLHEIRWGAHANRTQKVVSTYTSPIECTVQTTSLQAYKAWELWCMYGTVTRKYKAWDGTGDEDRNMSGMRIKASLGHHLENVRGYL